MPTQTEKAATFRELHAQPGAFIIPNPWDAGTARLLATIGFKALATTSLGLANTLGRADSHVTRDEVIANCRTIAEATDLPVNADLENGFADEPEAAAEAIRLAAEAGAIGASLLVRLEEPLDASGREAPALVLDIDENSVSCGARLDGDASVRKGELECVLQQIPDGRGEDVPIDIDFGSVIAARDRQPQPLRVRFESGDDLDFLDEVGYPHPFPLRNSGFKPHLGEGPIDRIAQAAQASTEHGAYAASHAHASLLDDVEGHHGAVELVS